MPKATVSKDTEKYDLKSLDGAFVELRQMSYGEVLRQRGLMQTVSGVGGSSKDGTGPRMEFRFEESRQFEFERCVVDHNLEDEGGTKLDFRKEGTLRQLDPRVAQEIENLIDKMNSPPTEEEARSFPQASTNGSDS